MATSLERLTGFVKLTHELQQVKRAILVNGENRQENDLEHSAQLALVALYICEVEKLSLDTKLVLGYALVHDMVEAYAGDTHFYDDNGKLAQKQREEKARERLKKEFPEFKKLHEWIEGYEARTDEESKFVYALDKLLPIINIYLDNGRTWRADGVGFNDLEGRKTAPISLSPEIKKYYDLLLEILRQNKHLFPSSSVGASKYFLTRPKA